MAGLWRHCPPLGESCGITIRTASGEFIDAYLVLPPGTVRILPNVNQVFRVACSLSGEVANVYDRKTGALLTQIRLELSPSQIVDYTVEQ